MATLGAVHSVGESVVQHLGDAHQLQRQIEALLPIDEQQLPECTFQQLSSAQLASNFSPGGNVITLYMYRIGLDKLLRTTPDSRTPTISRTRPLSLELHYLMSAWSASAEAEHTLMSWAMRELHMRPTFDTGRLTPASIWRQEEAIQITPSELPHEDTMRIWDAMTPSYRLTVSYIARVIRVDSLIPDDSAPVVTSRFNIEQQATGPVVGTIGTETVSG